MQIYVQQDRFFQISGQFETSFPTIISTFIPIYDPSACAILRTLKLLAYKPGYTMRIRPSAILLVLLILLIQSFGMTTRLSAQNPLYTDASATLPFAATSRSTMDVVAHDLDGDGDQDLVLAVEFQPNALLINDGTGNFVDEASTRIGQPFHDSEDIAVADFNNDGYPDIIFVSEDDSVHEYYLNNGTAVFSDVSNRLPASICNAVGAADLNNDSIPDLVLGNAGQNLILINDSVGFFTDETASRLPAWNDVTQDLKIVDVDNDNDLDIFFGNEDSNRLLINDGNGVFTDETTQRLSALTFLNLETRKVEFGDVDGDQDPDIFLANVAFIPGKDPKHRLFLNDGNGFFTEATTQLPNISLQTLEGIFEDFDLDGDHDLVNVHFPNQPWSAYENDGAGNFSFVTSQVFPAQPSFNGIGVLAVDVNGDTLRDLYFCAFQGPDKLLLRNGPVSATNPRKVPELAVRIGPQPVGDRLRFEFEVATPMAAAFELIDMAGRRLLVREPREFAAGTHQLTIELPEVSSGTYLLRCKAEVGVLTQRFVLQ